MKTVCIAGKNNIAVDILSFLRRKYSQKFNFVAVCNKTDLGTDSFQRSFKRYCADHGVEIKSLEDLYSLEDLIFISLEFDRIVVPSRFRTDKLFNIHFSLLPAYKGMFTSVFPILNGEKFAGVTFHRINAGIDTGEIIAQKKFKIDSDDTCRDLYFKFIKAGTRLVRRNLASVLAGTEKSFPQPAKGSSYYSKKTIDFKSLKIDLNQTADNIRRQIRAFSFREYQMPVVFGETVICCEITNCPSVKKPGEVLKKTEHSQTISTIDYDVVLHKDRTNDLLKACCDGDLETVIGICSVREHLGTSNARGWTPLIVATYNNQKEIVDYLLSSGTDIFATNNNGCNLLMYAKDAYLNTGDNTLFKRFYNLGLSPKTKDFSDRDLYFYLKKQNLSLRELLS
ncbi:MAG: ankyrin repeat domain-containing protein [Opitutales bacterium]|nr:ankyrin repeat domain-containing protein [Opitutales bacterium]